MNRMDGKALLTAPASAWPTLILFVCVVGLWTGSAVLLSQGLVSPVTAAIVSTVAAFAGFTPFHDAAHRSVSRHNWINEVVGRGCALLLFGPFPAFRYVHLEHHKHTNDPSEDPDYWSGRGPVWLLPLRWLTQDLHYYFFTTVRWRDRPAAELIESAATLLAIAVAIVLGFASNHGLLLLACWIVPSRLALMALSFSFDYLPHKPHFVLASEDPYRATRLFADPLLTPIFLYQNYHLIHHLYPGIPFYRYARVWREKRDELIRRGAREERPLAWIADFRLRIAD